MFGNLANKGACERSIPTARKDAFELARIESTKIRSSLLVSKLCSAGASEREGAWICCAHFTSRSTWTESLVELPAATREFLVWAKADPS